MTIRPWVYLVMSVAYMVSSVVACSLINQDPYDNSPWLIAAPSGILSVMLLVVMLHDLLS